jgi:hypothetical protein
MPEKRTTLPIEQEAGWAPQPVLTNRKREKSLVTEKNRTPNLPASIPFTIYATQPSITRHISPPTSIFFVDLLHQKLQFLSPVLDVSVPPKSLSHANNRNSLSLVGANVRAHRLHF